jgi:ABC-2 type transport system ATP-binding protein
MSNQSGHGSIVRLESVSFSYKERKALDDFSLQIDSGEIFCLLGPNGSGKSTLFRLLSTSFPWQKGEGFISGFNIARDPAAIRSLLGVLFQSPSLDGKLRVSENLACGGRMFGLQGRALRDRMEEVSEITGIRERWSDLVETLSGGFKRRVEIAKALLSSPKILLLDEPTTGLDPGIRISLWNSLHDLRQTLGITIIFTSHLMDEASRADRVAVLHQGKLVAQGRPEDLCASIGQSVLTLDFGSGAEGLLERLRRDYDPGARLAGGRIHIETGDPHELSARIASEFGLSLRSMTISRPTLQDVFLHHTGMTLDEAEFQPSIKP